MKCNTCSDTAVMGKKSCKKCLRESKKRAAERYKKIKENRLCKSCPNKVIGKKGIYCVGCTQKRKDTWFIRKNSGVCITCGKNQKEEGLKCKKCYQANLRNEKKRKESRLKNGCCVFCDNERVNNRLCLIHYLKFTSKAHLKTTKRHKELHNLFEKQNGICPYTKLKLTLGVDASIDHIVPKSRGGALNDINNLQWIYCNVNFMKGDMLEEEFFDLVKLISNNLING